MADVLIAGCGYVGTVLGRLLSSSGHRVWGLRRSATALPAPLEAIQADLTDLDADALPRRSFDIIYYLAGAIESTDDAYANAYVAGPGNLARVLGNRLQATHRFFFASSTRVFPHDAGEWLDESSRVDASDFRARRLLEGEATVSALATPSTRVRFAGIYGPGRQRLLERLSARPQGNDAATCTNRIHRDDAAGFLAHLLVTDSPADLYLGVDSEPATRFAIHRWLRGKEAVPDPGPLRGKRCSNERLVKSGYRLAFPSYREGYGDLLQRSSVAPPRRL